MFNNYRKTTLVAIATIVFFQLISLQGLFAQRQFAHMEEHMRFDEKSDFPKAIYNVKSRQYGGTPESMARQYLLENKELLKMEKDVSDMKVIEVKKSPAGNHVGFIQIYKGLSVFRSETVVSINHENRVGMVFNGHKPNIDVNTVPAISKDQALNLARQAVGVRKEYPNFAPTAELMIYEDSDGKIHLIWETILFASEPPGTWLTVVDAHSGKILEKFNTIYYYVNGTGKVFKPDPCTELRNSALKDSNDADYQLLQPAYKTVTLFDLNNAVGGIYRVRGRYAYSKDIWAPYDSVVSATNPNNFTFKRNQNGFEEVNAYYFIDNMRRYLGTLGFSPIWKYPAAGSETMAFDTKGDPYNGSYYNPVMECLNFGMPPDKVDNAEDQNIILHEYGHALHDALIFGGIERFNDASDTRGISEGIGDYLAIDYRRQLQPSDPYRPNHRFNWAEPPASLGGRDWICIKGYANAKYPAPPIGNWSSDPYEKMCVWASTLMDIEYTDATNPVGHKRYGENSRDITVRLALTSLYYISASATVQDYMWAIFQADMDIPEYKGMHLNDLADIFDNRGFFYYNKASGNITTNTTWSKPMLVTGDITVNSGVTLAIRPYSSRLKQSFVFFEPTDDRASGIDASKCEIIVNGTFRADSTTFTGPSKGSWYGILFTSSGTNNSCLNKCTIKNAFNAVSIDSKSPQVMMSFIDDAAKYGVYITGSSAQPMIQHNYIEADSACVLHFNGGNGYFIRNSFRNARYGVWVISGSPSYDYYATGRNIFETSIYQDKVKVNTGQPFLGVSQYFTIPNSGYKYIRNFGASTILATFDYWSANPPSATYFYGSVDRSNPLASPPTNPPAGPAWTLPKGMSDDFFAVFDKARMLFFDGKYQESREKFKELTGKYLDSEYSSYALNWYMLATEQLEGIETQAEYLNAVKKDKSASANTRFYALKWLLQGEMRTGTIEKAKKLAVEAEAGSIYDREISFDLAMGLFEYKGDRQGAEEVLGKVSEKFADDNTLEAVRCIRSQFVKDIQPNQPKLAKLEKADNGFTLGAFPNPSNASVKILYGLEHSGRVSVAIYNILGQKVLTLVDKEQEAGRHEAVWDGKDVNGKTVSSGMYLCRFETKGGYKTLKLLMTK